MEKKGPKDSFCKQSFKADEAFKTCAYYQGISDWANDTRILRQFAF